MADDGYIRVKRPDGKMSEIPLASLKEAVKRGYTYAPDVPTPAKADVQSPENPAYQGMTTFAAKAAGFPDAMAQSAWKPGEPMGNDTPIGDKLKSMNPIDTQEGSFAMNTGGTAFNLIPFLADPEGVGKIGKAGIDAVKAGLDKGIQTPTRIALQKIGGAGKEPVLLENMRRNSRVQSVAKENAAASQQWVKDAFEAKKSQQEAAANMGKKEALSRGMQAYSDRLLDNIKQTYARTKASLDQRWSQMRTTPRMSGGVPSILKDEPTNSVRIRDAIADAKQKYLMGSPESLKQFNDLTSFMETHDSIANESGGMRQAVRPLTWDELRTHYSALGDRMYSGDLPGNVFNALRSVRNAAGDELQQGANRFGSGPAYRDLLNDHSQFESDWRDMSSVASGGGSPLARAMQAPSGAVLLPQVTGVTGDLLLQRLGKYADKGGQAELGKQLRDLRAEYKKVPSTKAKAIPDRPQPKPTPAPVDPVALRRKILTQYAARPVSAWDFVPPRLFERPLMSVEAIRKWVSEQPRKELQP